MRKTCFDMIYELAKNDKRIVYIGSDLGAGTLQQMKEEMPDQFFMEGIQEQNIIGMATGLALSGKIVYVNTIASFLTRRCYEQIYLDIGLHNAPVRLLGNGGGLVYAPLGPTHLATDDIALMRNIPNMTILAPCDAEEMRRLMPQTVDYPHPIYIRFAMGGEEIVSQPPFKIGYPARMKQGSRAIIITTGITTQIAMQVRDVTIYHCPTIYGEQMDFMGDKVITVEEHNIVGGLGDFIHAHNKIKIGLPLEYIDRYGSQQELLKYYGITKEAIEDAINR